MRKRQNWQKKTFVCGIIIVSFAVETYFLLHVLFVDTPSVAALNTILGLIIGAKLKKYIG